MNDTSDAVSRRYRELLLARSGAERLRMGCDMFDTSRALVRASLAATAGGTTAARLFFRTYGADFDAETRERIAAALEVSPSVGARIR